MGGESLQPLTRPARPWSLFCGQDEGKWGRQRSRAGKRQEHPDDLIDRRPGRVQALAVLGGEDKRSMIHGRRHGERAHGPPGVRFRAPYGRVLSLSRAKLTRTASVRVSLRPGAVGWPTAGLVAAMRRPPKLALSAVIDASSPRKAPLPWRWQLAPRVTLWGHKMTSGDFLDHESTRNRWRSVFCGPTTLSATWRS